MAKKHKDRVADLEGSEAIKAYKAANLDFEDALTYLVQQLEEKGIANDTVIAISADHYPYGLDGGSSAKFGQMQYLSELYGENVTNIIQRDHNRLIIWCGCLEEYDPIVVDTPVCSIDLLPTLSNLFGTEWDSRLLPGRDVFSDAMPLAFMSRRDWKTDLGVCLGGKFTPYDENAEIPEDYVKTVNAIVSKKYDYCKDVLNTDYYGHLANLGLLK
jgi:lipoteichoic acid synthase